MGSAVALLHLIFAWLLSKDHSRMVAQPQRADPIRVVFLESDETDVVPPVAFSTTAMDELSKRLAADVPPLDMPLVLDDSDPIETEAATSSIIVAPRILEAELPEVAPYANMAGLSTGQTSMVVLRIEVMPDGSVGRIRIDVSSGSKQVDEAAIRFAEMTRWIPGSVGGINERVWTRYGVQLMGSMRVVDEQHS